MDTKAFDFLLNTEWITQNEYEVHHTNKSQ